MSIVNLCIDARRALVGVDTAVARHGGDNIAAWSASKLRYIPRANALVLHAGWIRFGLYTGTWCDSRMNLDLGGLVEALPAQLPEIFAQFTADERAEGGADGAALDRQHVALVGYSERLGKMIARGWDQKRRDTGFEEFIVEPHLITPWGPEMRSTAVPNTAGRMIELARAQRDWAREHEPIGNSIGGHFLVAELTRRSCKIDDVFDLDADAAHAPEMVPMHAVFARGGGAVFGSPQEVLIAASAPIAPAAARR